MQGFAVWFGNVHATPKERGNEFAVYNSSLYDRVDVMWSDATIPDTISLGRVDLRYPKRHRYLLREKKQQNSDRTYDDVASILVSAYVGNTNDKCALEVGQSFGCSNSRRVV